MLVDVVAIIITVVLIIILGVSSLATLGTAQTLAHNNGVFTGRQKNRAVPGTASFLPGRKGPSKGSAQLLIRPHSLQFSQQSGAKAESRFR